MCFDAGASSAAAWPGLQRVRPTQPAELSQPAILLPPRRFLGNTKIE